MWFRQGPEGSKGWGGCGRRALERERPAWSFPVRPAHGGSPAATLRPPSPVGEHHPPRKSRTSAIAEPHTASQQGRGTHPGPGLAPQVPVLAAADLRGPLHGARGPCGRVAEALEFWSPGARSPRSGGAGRWMRCGEAPPASRWPARVAEAGRGRRSPLPGVLRGPRAARRVRCPPCRCRRA